MSINSVTSYIPSFQSSTISSFPKTPKDDPLQQSPVDAITTKWGFKVDEHGFFGADFNKATGIPEKVKIHQTMMDTAQEYATARKDGTDPMTVVSKVWKLYETVTGKTLDPDNDGLMSPEDVEKMPRSYLSKGSLLDGISAVQHTEEEMMNSCPIIPISPNPGFRVMGRYSCGSDTEVVKNGRDEYMNYTGTSDETLPKDKFSVGELFGNFFYARTKDETEEYSGGTSSMNFSTIHVTKDFFNAIDRGGTFENMIKTVYGENWYKDIVTYGGTNSEGKFSQELADKLLAELEKSYQEQVTAYKKNKNSYPQLDPSSSKDIADESSQKNSYAPIKHTSSLPNGSLISVAT